jgi:hypothetical protein
MSNNLHCPSQLSLPRDEVKTELQLAALAPLQLRRLRRQSLERTITLCELHAPRVYHGEAWPADEAAPPASRAHPAADYRCQLQVWRKADVVWHHEHLPVSASAQD